MNSLSYVFAVTEITYQTIAIVACMLQQWLNDVNIKKCFDDNKYFWNHVTYFVPKSLHTYGPYTQYIHLHSHNSDVHTYTITSHTPTIAHLHTQHDTRTHLLAPDQHFSTNLTPEQIAAWTAIPIQLSAWRTPGHEFVELDQLHTQNFACKYVRYTHR